MIVDGVVSVLVLLGAGFALLGSLGLARFPDLLTRLHGPSKATTLGIGGLLLGSIVWFSAHGGAASVHELLITLFLVITTPVSAMFIAKAAREAGAQHSTNPPGASRPTELP